MTTLTALTELEKDVLLAVLNSEYQDAADESVIGNPIWSNCLDNECKVAKGKEISGAASSLKKKGLVGTQKDGKDSTIWLTKAGFEAANLNS